MTRTVEWLQTHWWVFVVLAVTEAGTVSRHPLGHGSRAAGLLLAAAAVLPLLARVRWPEATVLVNAAATAAYFLADLPDGPIYLSLFFSAYAIAVRRPVRRWWRYAASVLVVVASQAVHRDSSATGEALRATWFVAFYAASLAIGTAVRNRGETRRERVARTATEERLRMAEDLHDGVGHGLAVIAMQAGVALHVLDRDPGAVRASLEAIRDTSRESLDALRSSLNRLAPSERQAPRAPRRGLADLPVLLSRVRAGGLAVTAEVASVRLPDDVDETAYVVVQEALTNVLRHAAARSARVGVAVADGGLLVSVSDDGQGGPVTGGGSGLGIPGMRARVERLGGSFEAGPADGGFVVRAWLPLGARS